MTDQPPGPSPTPAPSASPSPSASLAARIAPDDLKRLRRALMDRGQKFATKLSQLLSADDPMSIIRALGLDAKPGLRPEEVLRKALDDNERIRKLIDADDDSYGRCVTCGVALDLAMMREVPWADGCHAHP